MWGNLGISLIFVLILWALIDQWIMKLTGKGYNWLRSISIFVSIRLLFHLATGGSLSQGLRHAVEIFIVGSILIGIFTFLTSVGKNNKQTKENIEANNNNE